MNSFAFRGQKERKQITLEKYLGKTIALLWLEILQPKFKKLMCLLFMKLNSFGAVLQKQKPCNLSTQSCCSNYYYQVVLV